jgi:hypothetical protein
MPQGPAEPADEVHDYRREHDAERCGRLPAPGGNGGGSGDEHDKCGVRAECLEEDGVGEPERPALTETDEERRLPFQGADAQQILPCRKQRDEQQEQQPGSRGYGA